MTFNCDRKLRVIHIISGDLWAGAETMAFNLLRRLRESNDLHLSVILLNKGRLAEELRAVGITVFVIEESINSFWKIFRKILAIAHDFHPDIIHSHRNKENLLAFFVSRFHLKTKLVSTLHGLPELGDKKPNISQWLKIISNQSILSRFFHTVAVSNDIKDALIKRFNFSNRFVEVIHNGIECSDSIEKVTTGKTFVIGSSGRLFPVKDYPLMVEIARILTQQYSEKVRFELAGDGPEKDSIIALLKEYGLVDNFSLLGHQDDMVSFYNGLDIYLNTSIHEGIPMTILEAMSHGLPVVAPTVGGIVEIISNGENGFLVASRDPAAFAQKCIAIIENESVRLMLSQAALATARESFSAELMAAKYLHLYKVTMQQPAINDQNIN